jgi:CubicO group peptidase (beta-lactamase class C family)
MTAASHPGGDGRISAAVRVNGELRSVATDFPAHAVFPIYSITKTLTAICVLRLVEAGSLRLIDAARKWLPDVSISSTITLAHLLRHKSGLRDYVSSSRQVRVFLTRTSDTCCS